MSYLAAFASVFYEIEIILLALGMTTLVTLGVALIATITKVLAATTYISRMNIGFNVNVPHPSSSI